jgi:hypothetical protein
MFRRRSFTAALVLILGASAAAFGDVVLSADSYAHAAPAPAAGIAAPRPATAGAYVAIRPFKVVDTRTGARKNRKGAIPAKQAVSFQIAAHGGVPRTHVGSVAVRVVVIKPPTGGSLTLYRYGSRRPAVTSVLFRARGNTTKAAIAQLSPTGRLSLWNASNAPLQVEIFVDGYYIRGKPTAGGTYAPIAPKRVIDTRTGAGKNRRGRVGARTQFVARITGRANIPAGSAAVVGVLSVVNPAVAGSASVWKYGVSRPKVASLRFAGGINSSVLVTVPLSKSGRIVIRNSAKGKTDFVFDAVGYILPSPPLPLQTSVSHYIRNLAGGPGDATVMQALGATDAARAGTSLVVLHIGAQRGSGTGVLLSGTNRSLTYAQLVTAVQAYLSGLGSAPGVTVAVATNNDNNGWAAYSPASRGSDWWTLVVAPLQGWGVPVVGANDIEPGFASTVTQALTWESAYVAAAGPSQRLIFTGSADGCPHTLGSVRNCNYGWTQAQLYALAGGDDPEHIQALPQIYNPVQAGQWPNIDRTGGGQIVFVGALTEQQACATSGRCVSWGPSAGLAALVSGLQAATLPVPQGLVATDLDIQ